MRTRHSTGISSGRRGAQEKIDREDEQRRRYNREYMRSWRANPVNRIEERENRRRWQFERKLREALKSPAPFTNERGKPVCGFCRINPPLREIVRLQVSEIAPRGYVELRIPYCGEC